MSDNRDLEIDDSQLFLTWNGFKAMIDEKLKADSISPDAPIGFIEFHYTTTDPKWITVRLNPVGELIIRD